MANFFVSYEKVLTSNWDLNSSLSSATESFICTNFSNLCLITSSCTWIFAIVSLRLSLTLPFHLSLFWNNFVHSSNRLSVSCLWFLFLLPCSSSWLFWCTDKFLPSISVVSFMFKATVLHLNKNLWYWKSQKQHCGVLMKTSRERLLTIKVHGDISF